MTFPTDRWQRETHYLKGDTMTKEDNKVRLYRFYNTALGKWGEPFSMCDKHKEEDTVPDMLIMDCIADNSRLQCNFCEQEVSDQETP